MGEIGDFKHIVLVGDGQVGKTSLVYAFKNGYFTESYIPTIYDVEPFVMTLNEKKYLVKVHDTAGQEEFQRLRQVVYDLADVFILCYSIPDRFSFDNISLVWSKELRKAKPNVPIILVGTKEDQKLRSSVSLEEAEDILVKIRANKVIESSAKTLKNTEEVFMEALRATETGILRQKRHTCVCWCGKT